MPEDTSMAVIDRSNVPQVAQDARLWASADLDQVHAQVAAIKELMKVEMTNGVHYGTIPGTAKPTLLQPGAQKLCLLFRLAPRYRVTRYDLPNGHREYEIVCELYHAPTNTMLCEGVGLCTTMEKKYRYRGNAFEVVDEPIPQDYRDNKSHYRKQGFGCKKVGDEWVWVKFTDEKEENPDIADTYNTVFKIAKKRACVDACLTGTAASDLFTQDLEDLEDDHLESASPKPQSQGTQQQQRSQTSNGAKSNGQKAQSSQQQAEPPDWKKLLKAKMKVMGAETQAQYNAIVAFASDGQHVAEDCADADVAKKVFQKLQASKVQHVRELPQADTGEQATDAAVDAANTGAAEAGESDNAEPAQADSPVAMWKEWFKAVRNLEEWVDLMDQLDKENLPTEFKKEIRTYGKSIKQERDW